MITVHIWPDGTTCLPEDLPNKSNDYEVRQTDHCERCGQLISPHYKEPFASCAYGTQEWYL